MTNLMRAGSGTGVAALGLAAFFSVLATPRAANATPLLIGEFFFDRPDGVSATVHLTNESPAALDAFTITFVNDVEFEDGSRALDTQSIDQDQNGALNGFSALEVLPTDLAPPFTFSLTPLTAKLSNFVFSTPGAISFSPDGGGTFESSAMLDLTLDGYGFGIFLEVPEATDPSPVPEPGTLLLLASGAAASTFRRRRLATAFSFAARVARSSLNSRL